MKKYTNLSSASKLDIINEARSVLNGTFKPSPDLKALYQQLEKMDQFAYATEILLVKMRQDEKEGNGTSPKELNEEYETLAKYIYKDHALPSNFKFERAIRELKIHNNLFKTKRCETLGLAGAIYKRKWQFDHQFKNLVLARYYYQKGFESWKECLQQSVDVRDKDKDDEGYTAINFAYINTLMAVDNLEEHGRVTGVTESIYARFKEADETRRIILTEFIKDPAAAEPELKNDTVQTWVLATIAEAYFGLHQYKQALHFIQQYLQRKGSLPWETRSFHQQLFSIAYLQMFQKNFAAEYSSLGFSDAPRVTAVASTIVHSKINECLSLFDSDKQPAANSNAKVEVKKVGKFGLALSGGGFRASLFHIGVLAALAEKDELRNIEVISCVSGGSIIGAYYYLKLKMLLETKTDEEINRNDYIRMVQDIERDFLAGVQKNLRMHIFSSLESNFKMFRKDYSRSHRLGELYEEHLYSRILKNVEDYNKINGTNYQLIPEENKGKFYMHNLYVNPKGAPEGFTPVTDNWKRKNKIPQLVLNATTVNTGHNWQFTASWMGESPNYIQVEIDAKPRLRRMYYKEAPPAYQNFRLGYAVGASSCVPVMFHPMPLPGLYENFDLQLIDGGLHDNQGIATLLEQECNNLFISDASGQLPTNKIATGDGPAIFFRSDNILQERLRELQFLDVRQRNETTQISKLYKVHLKSNLQERPMNWINCNDPARTILEEYYFDNTGAKTSFGIDRRAQRVLSEIRTDLDSFNDTEAYALMYNAYVQTNFEFSRQKQNQYVPNENFWRFAAIKPYVTNLTKYNEIEKTLKIGKNQFLKLYAASDTLRYAVYTIGVVLAIFLGWMIYVYWNSSIEISVRFITVTLGLIVLGMFSKLLASIINIKGTIKKYLAYIALTFGGYLVFNAYLKFFNGMYNKGGKIDHDKEPEVPEEEGKYPLEEEGKLTVFEKKEDPISMN